MPTRFITRPEYLRLAVSDIGGRIRYLREQMGHIYGREAYTTSTLARLIGVTPQSLSAIERGEIKSPSFKIVSALAKSFHVPIEVFTDEYYQETETKLFTIGFDDTGEQGYASHCLHDEDSFRVGFIVYQLFDNDDIRIVISNTTKSKMNTNGFLQLLAGHYAQIQIIDREMGDASIVLSPYKQALEQYKALNDFPNAFPRVPIEEFHKLVDQLIDRNADGKPR